MRLRRASIPIFQTILAASLIFSTALADEEWDPETEYRTNEQAALAYQPFSYYFDSRGHLVCTTPKPLIARLWAFDYWLGKHPFNNRFNELLEVMLEDKNVELNMEKARNKRRTKIITIAVSIPLAILSGFGGFKLGYLIGSK